VKFIVTERFMIRAEIRHYIISTLNTAHLHRQDDNQNE